MIEFARYFSLRLWDSPCGEYVRGMVMLPLLLIGWVLCVVIMPVAWVASVYDDWKDLD